MIKINGKYKFLFYIFFLSLVVSVQFVNANNTSDLIEITQVVQDVNDVGIVLNDDISNHVSTGSYIYILILLNQSSDFNGLYIAGFGVNGSSMLSYRLGNPLDSSNIWFDKGNDSITNYGSIIYLDILDYLIAFGPPEGINGLVISLPDSFNVIKDNIYPILNDYQNYLISGSTTTSTTMDTTTSSTSNSSKGLSGFGNEILFLTLTIPIIIRKIKK